MQPATLIILVAIIVVLVGAGLWYLQRQRSVKIKRRFGPEYDRTVTETGDRRKAEQILEKREKRVERFQIRPISAGDRERFTNAWANLRDDIYCSFRCGSESSATLRTAEGSTGRPLYLRNTGRNPGTPL